MTQYISENPPQLFHDEELRELFESLLMKTRDETTHKISTFLTVDDFLFELRTLGVKLTQKESDFIQKYILKDAEKNG